MNVDWRVKRITQELRKWDRTLFAHRRPDGTIQVLRQAERFSAADALSEAPDLASLRPQFILALTDNWNLTGKAVDMGLEPLMRRIMDMDLWRDPDSVNQMRARRERAERDKQRARRNEIRALAADMRRDFARATDGINTGGMEKADPRRKANGNC